MFCLSEFKQLDFSDQLSELSVLSYQQPVKLLKLLEENFDINTFVPDSFVSKYYSNLGRDRNFSLNSVISALIIMHIFRIPTTSLLCVFLALSKDIRNFCKFDGNVPDEILSADSRLPLRNRLKNSLIRCLSELLNSVKKSMTYSQRFALQRVQFNAHLRYIRLEAKS